MDVLLLTSLDLVAFYLANCIAFGLRFGTTWPLVNWHATISVFPVMAVSMVFISYLFDLHRKSHYKIMSEMMTSVGLANLLLWLVYVSVSFWFRQFSVPRSILVLSCFLNACLQVGIRVTFRYFGQQLATSKISLVIAASEREAKYLASLLQRDPQKRWGDITLATPPYPPLDDVLGRVNAVVIGAEVDKVYRGQVMVKALVAGKHLQCIPDGGDLLSLTAAEEPLGDILSLVYLPLQIRNTYQVAKRLIDILAGVLLLTLFSIPMLLLLVVIPLSSPGRPIYAQTRVGINGLPFRIFKFRTMITDAEKHSGPVLASTSDARVTPLGRFLRGTRLDETPQLINILKGDMSLVGPRPERPEFVSLYEQTVPYYQLRHAVRPGLTGLAQVNGYYSTATVEKLRYDLWYIGHYHPLQDLKILFRTAIVILHPRHAKGVDTAVTGTQKHWSSP